MRQTQVTGLALISVHRAAEINTEIVDTRFISNDHIRRLPYN